MSVYTGKTFGCHGVFCLGDCIYSTDRQIFADLEESGFRVESFVPVGVFSDDARSELI